MTYFIYYTIYDRYDEYARSCSDVEWAQTLEEAGDIVTKIEEDENKYINYIIKGERVQIQTVKEQRYIEKKCGD